MALCASGLLIGGCFAIVEPIWVGRHVAVSIGWPRPVRPVSAGTGAMLDIAGLLQRGARTCVLCSGVLTGLHVGHCGACLC